jgi:hypothetical protein
MKKLTLNLDALHVESFEPVSDRERSGGTVRAHEHSHDGACLPNPDDQYTRGYTCLQTCPGKYTCDNTCLQTCGDNNTCNFYLCGESGTYSPCL